MGQANDNRGRAGTNTPELPMLRNGGDGSIYPLPTRDANNARNMQEETTTCNGNEVTYLRDTWREKDNRKLKIPRNGGPTTGHADLKDTRNGGTTQPVES